MPEITKQNFRHTLYEIPKELQVDTEHTPILRVLQAEHPMVLNVLIDRCKVESRILMKDRIEATALVRTRPRNVTEVYLADGSRIMFKDGNVADESRRIRVAKLSRNNEGHVKTLKEQFKQLVQRAAELAQQRADILRERDDMRKVLDPFKSNKHQLEARYRSLSNKHHELTRNVPQPPPAQNPAEVADLESNLRVRSNSSRNRSRLV
jgi:chromosome segregation ATPase